MYPPYVHTFADLTMSVQRRKEQARAREEAKKARYARKTGAFVTLSTLGMAYVLPTCKGFGR